MHLLNRRALFALLAGSFAVATACGETRKSPAAGLAVEMGVIRETAVSRARAARTTRATPTTPALPTVATQILPAQAAKRARAQAAARPARGPRGARGVHLLPAELARAELAPRAPLAPLAPLAPRAPRGRPPAAGQGHRAAPPTCASRTRRVRRIPVLARRPIRRAMAHVST